MMVRAAVLKMKDPRQIIRDMEKLDEMGEAAEFVEFNLGLPCFSLVILTSARLWVGKSGSDQRTA